MALKKNPFTAWSYSRLGVYQKCPAQAKYKFIDKLPEPKAPALANGIKVHNEAEAFLKGKTSTLPISLKKLGPEFRKLKKLGAVAEEPWALTDKWEETGYFAKDTWLRIKIDSQDDIDERTLRVIDFKTGKIRLNEGYEEQLELYGVGGFSLFDIDKVQTELWFVDHGKIYGRGDNDDENQKDFQYSIKDYPKLVKTWKNRVKPFFKDTRFDPTPNFGCRWCHFSKSNGGPCKF